MNTNTQKRLIRQRLQRGSATSWELSRYARALNYTARISELREEGHEITCTRYRRNGKTIARYELVS